MNKKIPLGLKIICYGLIIFSIINLGLAYYHYSLYPEGFESVVALSSAIPILIFFVFISIMLLKSKNWARIILLIYLFVEIPVSIFAFFIYNQGNYSALLFLKSLVLWIVDGVIIYYLMRHNTKKYFISK